MEPKSTHFLPASQAHVVYVITPNVGTARRPTMEDLDVEPHYVLAWRIDSFDWGDCAHPVLHESIAVNQCLAYLQPDGGLMIPEIARFADLDALKEHYLAELQANWEKAKC